MPSVIGRTAVGRAQQLLLSRGLRCFSSVLLGFCFHLEGLGNMDQPRGTLQASGKSCLLLHNDARRCTTMNECCPRCCFWLLGGALPLSASAAMLCLSRCGEVLMLLRGMPWYAVVCSGMQWCPMWDLQEGLFPRVWPARAALQNAGLPKLKFEFSLSHSSRLVHVGFEVPGDPQEAGAYAGYSAEGGRAELCRTVNSGPG